MNCVEQKQSRSFIKESINMFDDLYPNMPNARDFLAHIYLPNEPVRSLSSRGSANIAAMYPYRIYKNRMKHPLGNFTCGPGGPDFLYKPNIPRPGNSLGDDETDTTPTATPEASRRGIQISIASREGTWPNDDLGKNANLKRWSFM